jgi:hypothetical protein
MIGDKRVEKVTQVLINHKVLVNMGSKLRFNINLLVTRRISFENVQNGVFRY